MSRMKEMLEEEIRNHTMEEYFEDIEDEAGYIGQEGYKHVETEIKNALSETKEQYDTTSLHNCLDKYYQNKIVKPEYDAIAGYLHCIGTNIAHMDYKKEHNL